MPILVIFSCAAGLSTLLVLAVVPLGMLVFTVTGGLRGHTLALPTHTTL